MRGWTHVVFRRESDGKRAIRSLDALLTHLDAWDRGSERRSGERRSIVAAREAERRRGERRMQPTEVLEEPLDEEPRVEPETRTDDQRPAPERKGGSDVEVAPRRTEGIADVSASAAARAAARARTDAPLIIVSRTS
jgi:hypothetical protein